MQTSKINKTNIVRRATQPVPIGRSFEAIKLLSDWTKWLVTIETASIAALGLKNWGQTPINCPALLIQELLTPVSIGLWLLLMVKTAGF